MIGSLRLTPEAETRVEELSNVYTAALVMQAKTLAYGRQDELVLPNHVNGASQNLRSTAPGTFWQETFIALGSIVFGAGLSALITQFMNGPTASLLWIGLSVVGILAGGAIFGVGLTLRLLRL